MAGRRIRWANVGRAAAIAAAVLAGLASLPALLGSDEPPPLPDDVGLDQVAQAPPPTPVAPAPVPPVAQPARTAPEKPAAPKSAATGKRVREKASTRPGSRDRGKSDADAAPAPAYLPAYVPTHAPASPAPPLRREFQLER